MYSYEYQRILNPRGTRLKRREYQFLFGRRDHERR